VLHPNLDVQASYPPLKIEKFPLLSMVHDQVCDPIQESVQLTTAFDVTKLLQPSFDPIPLTMNRLGTFPSPLSRLKTQDSVKAFQIECDGH
jgi:hypothetical protein